MRGVASEKVKGGKLVRVKLDTDGETVNSLQITGDFFLHPEESLEQMEQAVIGLSPRDEAAVAARLHQVIASNDAVLVGVSPDDIARLIKQAAEAST